MKKENLKIELEKEELSQIWKRYHFQEEEKEKLERFYEEVRKTLRVVIYYDTVKEVLPWMEEDESEYGLVLVSLGEKWEEYEEKLSLQGKYLEYYAMSCIGMEILKKSYVWIEKQWEEEGYFVGRYQFFGEHLPMRWIPWVFSKLKPKEVCYYKQSMLKPRSSVCYMVNFQREKKTGGLCEQCSKINCPNREK